MELEDGSGAHREPLSVQLHLFCLRILGLKGAAAQEVNTMRKAQLPALCVSFKVHQQDWKGVKWGNAQRERG